MNVDCEKIINNLDNSVDDFISYLQKIVILQVVQQIFCEILICGRKIVYTKSFFKSQISEKCVKRFIRF